MQYRLYFVTSLFLTAVLMQWSQPLSPLSAEVSAVPETSWLRGILRGLPAKLIPEPKHAFTHGIGTQTKSSQAPVTIGPSAEKPKDRWVAPPLNPKPNHVKQTKQALGKLTVRGLSVGMTLKEAKSLKKGGEVVDRLTSYWQGVQRGSNFGATWLQYGSYHGSFSVTGICGALYGDALERNGFPILAHGDTGADVERLLGPPYYAGHTRNTRYQGVTWTYRFGQAELSIYFRDGIVRGFVLRAEDFIDSAC